MADNDLLAAIESDLAIDCNGSIRPIQFQQSFNAVINPDITQCYIGTSTNVLTRRRMINGR